MRPAAETIFGTLILVQKKVWKSLEFDLKKLEKSLEKSGFRLFILAIHPANEHFFFEILKNLEKRPRYGG